MPKYLDMPEGNGVSPAYREFVEQIARGRIVSIIRIHNKDGEVACFYNSGEPTIELSAEDSLKLAVALTAQARDKVEAAGGHPAQGYTTELA